MVYFHTSIGYIDIDHVYIPEEFKKDEWLLDKEFLVNVDGNNEESDLITIGIDSGISNVGNLAFDLGNESARALADGIYSILKTRENNNSEQIIKEKNNG